MTPILEVSRFPVERRRKELPSCIPAHHEIAVGPWEDINNPQGPQKGLVVTNNGTIHVCWWEGPIGSTRFFYHAYSTNAGVDWTIQTPLEPTETQGVFDWDFHTDGERLYLIYYNDTNDVVRWKKTNTDGITWNTFNTLATSTISPSVNVWIESTSKAHFLWREDGSPAGIVKYSLNGETPETIYTSVSPDTQLRQLAVSVDSGGTPWAFFLRQNPFYALLYSRRISGVWGTPAEVPVGGNPGNPEYTILPRDNQGMYVALARNDDYPHIDTLEHNGSTWTLKNVAFAEASPPFAPYTPTIYKTPNAVRLAYMDIGAVSRLNGDGDVTRGWWVVTWNDVEDATKHTKFKKISELDNTTPRTAWHIYFYPTRRSKDKGWHALAHTRDAADILGEDTGRLWHFRLCG